MISKRFRYSAIVTAAMLVLLLQPQPSTAQALDFEAHPLRPADTSSPRDTLRSFLQNVNAAIFAGEQENFDEVQRARGRALQTLDFGGLPNPHSYEERTRRLIYLKEILDRIPLPPLEEVPGAAEVADETVSKWAIPDTQIAIARVADGERAGEYLFSAKTVARLHRYYRQSAHLPYKPGAAVGLLEDYLAYGLSEGTIASRIRSRLKSIDASSPRALLQQFLASVNAAYALMMEADAALSTDPPTITRAQALEIERKAGLLIERAVGTLDLSEVPEALRQDVGLETALMLKEVLDRVPLPPIESIPGARGIEAQRASGKGPIRWLFPNTDIEIAELTQGPQAGEFRFSEGTVHLAADNYDKVHDLPYRSDEGLGTGTRFSADYDSPQVSTGLYQYYISTPGYLVPGTSWLGPWLTRLPDGLTALQFGQTGWQWIGMALGVLAAAVAVYVVQAVGRLVTNRMVSPKAEWIKLLVPIMNAVIVIQLVDFIDSDLNTTGSVYATVLAVGTALVYLLAAAAAYRLSVAIAESIVASPRIVDQGVDASLVRLGARAAGFVISVYIVISGFRQLGADVVPLLAGLGVGGLAVALAVRPTLENMIGGVILYADRPIQVGDYCSFGDQSGTVEGIGLRSTRIRALDRTVITVPNAVFADMQLTNWARCDTMLITTVVRLRYETTPEQLRQVLAKMRQLCLAHPKIETDTLRVRFTDFGASSLDVTVRVYALTSEWNEYYAIREDLYLRFAEIIAASGTSIAVPSRTLYVGRDSGLDPDKVEAAEREVEAWRNADQLPFPRTPEPLAARITDSLDYPPRGSPEAVGKTGAIESEERLGGSEGPESQSEERLAGGEEEEHETDDASHRDR